MWVSSSVRPVVGRSFDSLHPRILAVEFNLPNFLGNYIDAHLIISMFSIFFLPHVIILLFVSGVNYYSYTYNHRIIFNMFMTDVSIIYLRKFIIIILYLKELNLK